MTQKRIVPKQTRTRLVLSMDESNEKFHRNATLTEKLTQLRAGDEWIDGLMELDLRLDEPLGWEHQSKTGGVLLADGRSWSVFVNGDHLVRTGA